MDSPQRQLPFLEDERDKGRKAAGFVVAVLVHALAAFLIYTVKPIERVRQVIVEVTMSDLQPEPEPEPELQPEPEPEPEKPKPPEAVRFEETVDEATPDAPEETPPADKPVRRIQGLDASSFAEGSGTGFTVRAGTTLRTRASDETMDLEEAASSVAFSAVTRQPKVRSWPRVVVPDSVKALGLEGMVHLRLDLDKEGQVLAVRVEQGLHPDADRACIEAWSKASIAPAVQGDTPVGVLDVPYRCRIEILR